MITYSLFPILFLNTLVLINGENSFVKLSDAEHAKLEKFRRIVSPLLYREFMKEDFYLLKWLKDASFDLEVASMNLKDTIRWRKRNKIDQVIKEDWTDMERDLKFVIDGCDNYGRPSAIAYVGDWDIRKVIVTGKAERFLRYVSKIHEEVDWMLRSMQRRGLNHNMTLLSANLILETSSFTPRQHMCPGCLPLLWGFLNNRLTRYPQLVRHLIAVNTPQAAQPVWDFIKPLLSLLPTRIQNESIVILDKNRKQWEQKLLANFKIDASKMSSDMGGRGPDAVDFETIRKNRYVYNCPS